MISSSGNVKNSFVPWTCMISNRRDILIDPSFLSSSKLSPTKNVEFASTLRMVYFLTRSSSIFGWFGFDVTLNFTPSESGFASSLDNSLTSKKKLMLEQFLNGMFIVPLDGIFIILKPVFSFTISLRQTILGTSPLLFMGRTRGAKLSTCRIMLPLISVDDCSSGMLAFTMIGMGG